MPTKAARRHRLEAYLFMALITFLGFLRMESIVDQQAENRRASIKQLCSSVNTNRSVLRDLIEAAVAPLATDSDDSEEEIASRKGRREALEKFSKERLQPVPCEEIVEDPQHKS